MRCRRCGSRLRSDNRSGYCGAHRRNGGRGGNRRRVLGEPCAVEGCPVFRVVGSLLCPEHVEAWAESGHRMAAAAAVLRFLRTAGTSRPSAPPPGRLALLRAADAILGADFGKLAGTDALWRATVELPVER